MHTSDIIRRLHSNKTLLNGALFSMFSFFNRGISFVLLLILANYITPQEYGFLNLYSTVGMVLGYFIALSTQGYSSIVYFKEGNKGIAKTFSVVLLISSIMLCLYFAILLIGRNVLPESLHLGFSVLVIAILVSFFQVFSYFFYDYYRLKENVLLYGLYSCGIALLNFLVSIYFVKFLGLSWYGRVYAELLCTVLIGCISIGYFTKNGFLTTQIKDYIKPMLFWGVPLIPHLATTFIRQGCDRYIINSSHTLADVGLFSFALNLCNIITMVGYGFNQSNSVDIYKVLSNKSISDTEKIRNISKQKNIFLALYTCVTVLVIVCCYFILPIALPKYATSLQYFPILAIYGMLICYYLIYTNFLFFYKKTKILMYITLTSSVIHLLLSLAFTRYSLYITASLYVFTQLLVVLTVRWQANKLLKVNVV